MSKPTHTPGPWLDFRGDEIVTRNDETVARFWTRPGEPDKKLMIAAPDMLEALECAEDCRIAGGQTLFLNDLREKWGPRFRELFEGRELREIYDLFELDIALTRRAIAKAKGEAE